MLTVLNLKTVTLCKNPLEPETWTTHKVPDICEFLQAEFGTWPSTARIYHDAVAIENDITPRDAAAVEALQALTGRFVVVVYPGEPVTIISVISIALSVASYLLAPSPTSAANSTLRNTTGASANNELSDRQNKARPNERIPDIFGTVRSVPDLIASPYKMFENGREVEYAYMCIGRGSYAVSQLDSGEYDVRDGDTLISNIQGASVAIYGPNASPNSGDDPEIQIGSVINAPVLSTKRSNSVNGQVLRPPNAATLVGDGNIRFIYPNVIDVNPSSGIVLTDYFAEGDDITLTDAALTAGSTNTRTGKVLVFASTNVAFAESLYFVASSTAELSYYSAGGTITVAAATPPSSAYDTTLNLAGTYTIESAFGFWQYSDYIIVVKLVSPASVATDWNNIGSVAPIVNKYLSLEITVPPLTFDLDGTYSVISVSDTQMVLDDPSSVASDWNNLSTAIISPYLSPTIDSAGGLKWIGPIILDDADLTGFIANMVAQNGLYKDNGTTQTAVSIDVAVELTPVNSSDVAIGDAETYYLALTGSDTLKEQVAKTLASDVSFTGRCSVRAARITEHDDAYSGTVIDEVRWRDLYSSAPVEDTEFGNLTTVMSKTYATSSALAVKERKLNMEVTRKVPARVGSTSAFTTELYASNNAADIFCAVCLDEYIGKRGLSELDVSSIYDAIADVEDYFGHVYATEFCYTFDSDNTSFQEMAQAIAGVVFCIAYRRGSVIKWTFEKESDVVTLLFNHRNKVPRSEKRTTTFGNEYDGIEYSYVDPADDSVITLYLPEDQTATRPKKIESIGVRNHLQAYFHAWREEQKRLYRRIVTDFDATQEAELLLRNDRILVSDDTRPYSRAGEVVSVDGLELTLSQPYWDAVDLAAEDSSVLTTEDGDTITTEAGTHTIWLQHTDGIAEAIAVTAGSSEYKVVLADAPRLSLVTDPSKVRTTYVILGSYDTYASAFLVDERTPADKMTHNVVAYNYDARYYAHDTDYINDIITEDGYGSRGRIGIPSFSGGSTA